MDAPVAYRSPFLSYDYRPLDSQMLATPDTRLAKSCKYSISTQNSRRFKVRPHKIA